MESTCKASSTQEEEEFIEMELTYSSSNTSTPSKKSREFEFHMSLKESPPQIPCPADELFYKGKLLPLQLPPRLRMVQKLLLQNPNFDDKKRNRNHDDEQYELEQCRSIRSVALISKSFTAPPTNSSTPLESCNISPSESCRASCELNPDEYFFRWSTTTDESGLISRRNVKNSWSRKFRLMKDSSLSQKLKNSKSYLKSLFIKAAACSDESSTNTKETEIEERRNVHSKAVDYLNKYIKVGRKIPFGQFEKQVVDEESFLGPRRSFSGAIKRHCGAKCISSSSTSTSSSSTSASSNSSSNSSSFSVKSSGFYEINFLKKSSSVNSEIESAIEGAIAHCKKSQQHCAIKPDTGTGSCLYSAAAKVAACEGNGKSELSRI